MPKVLAAPAGSVSCLGGSERDSFLSSSPYPSRLAASLPCETSTTLSPIGPHPPPPPPPPPLAVSKAERRQCRTAVIKAFAHEVMVFARLVSLSNQKDEEGELRARVVHILDEHCLPLPVSAHNLTTWVLSILKEPCNPPVPSELVHALGIRQLAGRQARAKHRRFTVPIFLYSSPTRLDAFRHSILEIFLPRLSPGAEYPPQDHWVAPNAECAAVWGQYFASTRLPDTRKPKRKMYSPLVIDKSRLRYIIPSDVSCVVKDSDTLEIAFAVYRNFCGNPALLEFAKETVEDACCMRKSVRLEDAGRIVQIGYSGGSLHRPSFGVVRNLLWKAAETDSTRRNISTVMTYFWNRAKGVFPPEVIADMEDFYLRTSLPRLDDTWSIWCDDFGDLEFPASCGGYRYSRVPLAPGCAVLAHRYARVVHNEHQGHDYAINWQSLREGRTCVGGDFFLASYGLMMEAAPDCAFTWRPLDWHCSSLGQFDPFTDHPSDPNPPFNQHSIAFVSSARIGRLFGKLRNAKLESEAASSIAAFERLEPLGVDHA